MPLRPPYDSEQETDLLTARRLQVLEELRDLDAILDVRSHVGDSCPGCEALRAMYHERGRAIRRHHRQRMIRRMERIIRDCWQTHNSERWIALTARRLADNRAWCSCLGCRNPESRPARQVERRLALATLQPAPCDDGIDYIWPGSHDDMLAEVWLERECHYRGCDGCEHWPACQGETQSPGRPLTTMQAALAALDAE